MTARTNNAQQKEEHDHRNREQQLSCGHRSSLNRGNILSDHNNRSRVCGQGMFSASVRGSRFCRHQSVALFLSLPPFLRIPPRPIPPVRQPALPRRFAVRRVRHRVVVVAFNFPIGPLASGLDRPSAWPVPRSAADPLTSACVLTWLHPCNGLRDLPPRNSITAPGTLHSQLQSWSCTLQEIYHNVPLPN